MGREDNIRRSEMSSGGADVLKTRNRYSPYKY